VCTAIRPASAANDSHKRFGQQDNCAVLKDINPAVRENGGSNTGSNDTEDYGTAACEAFRAGSCKFDGANNIANSGKDFDADASEDNCFHVGERYEPAGENSTSCEGSGHRGFESTAASTGKADTSGAGEDRYED
jgi:hypothetical protein